MIELTPEGEAAFGAAVKLWHSRDPASRGPEPQRIQYVGFGGRTVTAPVAGRRAGRTRWAWAVGVLAVAICGGAAAVVFGGTDPNAQNRAVAREMEAQMSTDRLPDTQGTKLAGDETTHARYLRQKARERAAAKKRSQAAAATQSDQVSSSDVRAALDDRHLYLTLRSTNECNKGDAGCAFAIDHPSLSEGTDIYAAGQALRAIFDAEPSLPGAAVVLYEDGTPYLKVGCDSDAVDWSAAPSSVIKSACDIGF